MLDTYTCRFFRYRHPHFFCLQDVLKMCSRHALKTSSRHVFKKSWRRLENVFRVTNFVFQKSSRRLGRQKIVTLHNCWGRFQDKQIFFREGQGKKQVDAWKSLESSDKTITVNKKLYPTEMMELLESWNYSWDTKNWRRTKKVYRSKIVYKRYNKTYDFRKFKTIRIFGNEIRNYIIDMYMATDEQNHLAKCIKEFKTKTNP